MTKQKLKVFNIKMMLKASLCSKLGLPYIYKYGSIKSTTFDKYGLDCSQLIVRAFTDAHIYPEGFDQTAHGFYENLLKFKKAKIVSINDAINSAIPKKQNFIQKLFNNSDPEILGFDHLFFYGTPNRLGHISILFNSEYLIESGGAGSDCTSRSIAVTKKNAKVRFVKIKQRLNELQFVLKLDLYKMGA